MSEHAWERIGRCQRKHKIYFMENVQIFPRTCQNRCYTACQRRCQTNGQTLPDRMWIVTHDFVAKCMSELVLQRVSEQYFTIFTKQHVTFYAVPHVTVGITPNKVFVSPNGGNRFLWAGRFYERLCYVFLGVTVVPVPCGCLFVQPLPTGQHFRWALFMPLVLIAFRSCARLLVRMGVQGF